MISNTKRLAVMLLAASLLACDGAKVPEVPGYLYFSAGAYLGRMNLSTGGSEVVANPGDAGIEHLSELLPGSAARYLPATKTVVYDNGLARLAESP